MSDLDCHEPYCDNNPVAIIKIGGEGNEHPSCGPHINPEDEIVKDL